jgi:hypothetical protein
VTAVGQRICVIRRIARRVQELDELHRVIASIRSAAFVTYLTASRTVPGFTRLIQTTGEPASHVFGHQLARRCFTSVQVTERHVSASSAWTINGASARSGGHAGYLRRGRREAAG